MQRCVLVSVLESQSEKDQDEQVDDHLAFRHSFLQAAFMHPRPENDLEKSPLGVIDACKVSYILPKFL